jgi:hypothetical protein
MSLATFSERRYPRTRAVVVNKATQKQWNLEFQPVAAQPDASLGETISLRAWSDGEAVPEFSSGLMHHLQ